MNRVGQSVPQRLVAELHELIRQVAPRERDDPGVEKKRPRGRGQGCADLVLGRISIRMKRKARSRSSGRRMSFA